MKNYLVKSIEIFLAVVLVCFALAVVINSGIFPSNFKMYSVATGSMEPVIRAGSLIVVQEEDNYSVGEIVTFKTQSSSGFVATHRIVDRKITDSNKYYITKGDANPDSDSSLVSEDDVIGKEVFVIPFVGRITMILQTPIGVLLLVWIPSLILIIGESISLGKHWGSKYRISKIKILMILLGISFYIFPVTHAFLSDTANLSNLSLSIHYKEPEIEMSYVRETSIFSFKVKNTKFVTSIHYEVLYNDDGVLKAVRGDIDNDGNDTIEVSEYLGSCSSGVCTSDNPGEITLNLQLLYGNGETTSINETYQPSL